MEIIDLHAAWDDDYSSPSHNNNNNNSSSVVRAELNQKIANALSRDGFIQISNHGIPPESVIINAFIASRSFFNQDLSVKMKAIHLDKARRGYAAISTENFATLVGEAGKPNDTVEKFRIGPLNANSITEESITSSNSIETNTWVGTPDEFEAHISEYYRCMEQLTLRLLRLIAVACGLDPEFFTEKMNSHSSILTLNHYPDVELPPGSNNSLRVAEHTDVSMVTIVAQSGPGLQILSTQDVDGEKIHQWTDIPYVPGALVVNIGDCVADWSDGRLRSTRHRVLIPSGSVSGSSSSSSNCRSSLAYFVTPRYDALLSPWPTTSGEAEGGSNVDITENADVGTTFSEWRKRRVARAIKMLKTNPILWKSK